MEGVETGTRKARLAVHLSGELFWREVSVFSQTGGREEGRLSLGNVVLSIARMHIMGDETLKGTYRPHPLDEINVYHAGAERASQSTRGLPPGERSTCVPEPSAEEQQI